jgi:hypothetical protein
MDPNGPSPGPLTITVYREADVGPDGPRAGVAAIGGPLTITSPEYPQPYRFDALPKGAHVVVATVPASGRTSRTTWGHAGVARFISFGGAPFTRITGDVRSGKVDVALTPLQTRASARASR